LCVPSSNRGLFRSDPHASPGRSMPLQAEQAAVLSCLLGADCLSLPYPRVEQCLLSLNAVLAEHHLSRSRPSRSSHISSHSTPCWRSLITHAPDQAGRAISLLPSTASEYVLYRASLPLLASDHGLLPRLIPQSSSLISSSTRG